MPITYEEALARAKCVREDLNYCLEYEDCFMFNNKDDISFGGEEPVVVLKDSGEVINMTAYIDMESGADELREFDI